MTGYLNKSYLQGGRIRERVKLSILRQNGEVVSRWLIYHGLRGHPCLRLFSEAVYI